MKRNITWFLVAFLISFVAAYGLLSANIYTVTNGVTDLRLVGECELNFFSPPAQPVRTIALVCPHKDMIRLWPFPVKQPWFEDERERPPGNFIEAALPKPVGG